MTEQYAGGRGPSGPRAGFWRRLGAALVDGIIISIAYGVFLALFDVGLAYALGLAVGVAYFTYLEGRPEGQTLGKRALGIRVVDFGGGEAIGYGRAAIRYVGRFVSSLPFALGYLWMLWDGEKQTWHDKFANCVVVPEADYPIQRGGPST